MYCAQWCTTNGCFYGKGAECGKSNIYESSCIIYHQGFLYLEEDGNVWFTLADIHVYSRCWEYSVSAEVVPLLVWGGDKSTPGTAVKTLLEIVNLLRCYLVTLFPYGNLHRHLSPGDVTRVVQETQVTGTNIFNDTHQILPSALGGVGGWKCGDIKGDKMFLKIMGLQDILYLNEAALSLNGVAGGCIHTECHSDQSYLASLISQLLKWKLFVLLKHSF